MNNSMNIYVKFVIVHYVMIFMLEVIVAIVFTKHVLNTVINVRFVEKKQNLLNYFYNIIFIIL